MMKKLFLSILGIGVSSIAAFSQSARLQIIHNSPDPAAATVDIYANGSILYPDVAFRSATAFADVASEVPIEIAIAPGNSTNASEAVFTTTVTFTTDETYVVVANGLINPSGYNPFQDFGLNVFAGGRESSGNANETDVLVIHGSTDAPAVDVQAPGAGTIIEDLPFGSFTADYLDLPTNNYTLNITPSAGAPVVASFQAPLQTLNLGGAALVVVASGFLSPESNNNGPAFGLFAVPPTGGNFIALPQSTAKVQVIHNSPDAVASTVDVWVNNTQLNDVAFRTASAFLTVPAEINTVVGLADAGSTVASDATITESVVFEANKTYVVIANGILSPSGYEPPVPFSLNIFDAGQEASGNPAETDVLVFHGSTDAPAVDVLVPGVGTAVNDLGYGSFTTTYLELPTADYTLNIAPAVGSPVIASFQAPLETLNLQGAALVVVASGFLNPAVNSDGAAFGLYVAPPTGGALIALPASTAKVQVIHNCADEAAALVDIWVNNTQLNDVAFRTATAYINVPAEVSLNINVTSSASTSPANPVSSTPVTLEANKSYVVIAGGIVSQTGYNPSPDFALSVYDMGQQESGNPAETDVLVFHGSTDAPTVDVVVPGVGTAVNDLAYGTFNGQYLELPVADYTINLTPAAGSPVVASYQAPLQTLNLGGAALVVVASGFFNPADNSDGPAFGLFAVPATGGAFLALPASTATVQIIHNSADALASVVDLYVNETKFENVAFRSSTAFVDVPAEVSLNVGVAGPESTSPSEALINTPVTFEANKTYVVIASGIASPTGYNPPTQFSLETYDMAREEAEDPAEVDLLVFHGCTDAPTVDVRAGSTVLVDDIAYGEFNANGYLSVPAASYDLTITTADGAAAVSTYRADLTSLAGSALTVVASGFLNPANNSQGPGFGLFASLATGGALVELPLITSISSTNTLEGLNIYPNPSNGSFFIDFNTKAENVRFRLTDVSGKVVMNEVFGNMTGGRKLVNTDGLSAGIYLAEVTSAQGVAVQKISIR